MAVRVLASARRCSLILPEHPTTYASPAAFVAGVHVLLEESSANRRIPSSLAEFAESRLATIA